MSRRTDQINSTLLRAIQERLARGLADPRVRGLITVTGVEVTPDLDRAKVRVTVMPEEHESLAMHGLKAASGKIRRDVAEKVSLRQMPQLDFRIDEGLKEQAKVMALLAKDRAERDGREPTDTDPDTPHDAPQDAEKSA